MRTESRTGVIALIWAVCFIFVYSLCVNKVVWVYKNSVDRVNDYRLFSAILVNLAVIVTTWFVLVEVGQMN